MPADLHIHSKFSDGTESPEEIVNQASKAGLSTIAITDHDVISGIEAAQKRGRELEVEVIPGIEFSTETDQTEIHILGYFIDTTNPELLAEIKKIQNARADRICQICQKLKDLGLNLEAEKVFSLAGHKAAGRPHVARVLLQAGYVPTFKEAFNQYLKFGGPAYVSHYKLSPQDAVKLIRAAGGVAVYAHPAVSNCDEIIPDLIAVGLSGIEARYISHKESQTEHYLGLAEKYGLVVTGGSDYHGANSGREVYLGDVSIGDQLVKDLKNEHARRNKS